MKLITKQLEKLFAKYPTYSQDGKGLETICLCKYFFPMGAQTWYVTEAQKTDDGDYLLFGLVTLFGDSYEWGSFLLSELMNIEIKTVLGNIKVERDMHVEKMSLADLCKQDKLLKESLSYLTIEK